MATSRLNEDIINDVVDDVLVGGADDWVHLPELTFKLTRNATHHGIELNEEDKVDLSLKVIYKVLTQGLMVAGDLPKSDPAVSDAMRRRDWEALRKLRDSSPKHLVAWALEPAAAYEQIEREWRLHDRAYKLGEGCWLENTDTGNERGLAMRDEVNHRFNRPPPGSTSDAS